MPRVKLNEEKYAGDDFLTAIQTAVMVPGERVTKALMAQVTGIPESTMKTRIADPLGFSIRELRKLAKAGVPGEAVLAVCGYKPIKTTKAASADDIADLLKAALKKIAEEGIS